MQTEQGSDLKKIWLLTTTDPSLSQNQSLWGKRNPALWPKVKAKGKGRISGQAVEAPSLGIFALILAFCPSSSARPCPPAPPYPPPDGDQPSTSCLGAHSADRLFPPAAALGRRAPLGSEPGAGRPSAWLWADHASSAWSARCPAIPGESGRLRQKLLLLVRHHPD